MVKNSSIIFLFFLNRSVFTIVKTKKEKIRRTRSRTFSRSVTRLVPRSVYRWTQHKSQRSKRTNRTSLHVFVPHLPACCCRCSHIISGIKESPWSDEGSGAPGISQKVTTKQSSAGKHDTFHLEARETMKSHTYNIKILVQIETNMAADIYSTNT